MVILEQPMSCDTAIRHTDGVFFSSVLKINRHVFSGLYATRGTFAEGDKLNIEIFFSVQLFQVYSLISFFNRLMYLMKTCFEFFIFKCKIHS